MIRGRARCLGRSTFGGSILLAFVLLPTPIAAQRCALDMALGTALPAGRVPNATEADARLSPGFGVGLGLECGSAAIRYGIDLDSYRLNARDFKFGHAVGVAGLLARLGYGFGLAEDRQGPWVVVAVQAGVVRVSRVPKSYLAILYAGRQLEFGSDMAVGGNVRLGFPVSSRWSVLLDTAVRTHFLSTFDPAPGGLRRPGRRTLVTIPVRVGVRLTL
ncbi:hypothetical protein [Candidatus Palauibacter sp.]|uniref:hypothetical protein n=1 Tax=Candidatus Palauibacter sp. TaxID=3101350 RepID=UPI003B02D804